MADWDVVSEAAPSAGKPLYIDIPGSPGGARERTAPLAQGNLPPEADTLYQRVRKAEGTAAGDGYVYYGGQSFKPGKDFPEWEGAQGPKGQTHAAGPGQWQPGTWNGLKPAFKEKFGHDPDFSSDDDQKAMVWLNGEKTYGPNLAEDIKSGKLDTSKLSSQWAGFGRGGSPWAVTQNGKWKVGDKPLAYEFGRSNTDVAWIPPQEYRDAVMQSDRADKRKSLLKSLNAGDEIESLPSLEVKVENGRLKIIDYDGANRAKVAIDEGVDLIPVAIHGVSRDKMPAWFEDMHGNVRPWDFTPVPKPAPEAPSRMERFGTGVADVGVGAAQFFANANPPGATSLMGAAPNDPWAEEAIGPGPAPMVNQLVAEREKGIEAERAAAGQTGTDWWRVGGNMVGTAPLAAAGPVGAGVRGAMIGGAVAGAVSGAVEPVTHGDFATGKAGQIGLGGLFGGAIGAGGNAAAKLLAPAARAGVSKLENKARDLITRRFEDRAAGSGATASDVGNTLSAARAEGQPMTLADIPELQGLAGTVARAPGEAGGRIRSFFSQRRDAALQRLDGILAKYLPSGSVQRTMQELASERAKQAAPVYEEAFAGGSIAPLEKQLQTEWNSAASVAKNAEQTIARLEGELTAATARQSTAGNVYATSAANRNAQFSKDKIAEQRRIATAAREDEQTALQRLRQAQQDGTASTPGAIWSPAIQRLVTNPRVRAGINKGIQIERDLADAEGRPMRLNEYAIVGQDAAGEPIVGAAPNMKLLAAAKKGLDAMVAGMRHAEPPWRMTEEGRAVDAMRRKLVDELYRLNPKYKEANEIWSGGAENIRALVDGQHALDRRVSIDDVRKQLEALPEGSRDFYRLGLADEARKDLLNVSLTGDKTKAIVNSEAAREKLRYIIGSPEDAERFIQAIETERRMFNTERTVAGGSQTAERVAEDYGTNAMAAMLHVGRAFAEAATYHPLRAAMSVLRGARDLRGGNNLTRNPALANEVAKLLSNPGLVPGAGPAQAGRFLPRQPVFRPQPSPVRNALAGGVNAAARIGGPAAGFMAPPQ